MKIVNVIRKAPDLGITELYILIMLASLIIVGIVWGILGRISMPVLL